MNVTRNSRKRSHKSQPISGRFTRSSSQLFLHRNRSGQIRPDPVRFPRQMKPCSVPVPKLVEPCPVPVPVPVPFDGNGARQGYSDSEFKILIDDICKQYSESDPEDNILLNDLCKKAKRDDDDLPTATTKDLRARRVYSPQSNADNSSCLIGSALSNGSSADSDQEIAELGFGTSTSAENGGTYVDSVTDIPDLGFSCETPNFDQGNIESSDGSGKLQDNMQIDGKDGGYCMEKIDDFDEEPVQTTPPDAVICGNLKLDGDARKTEEALPVEDSQRNYSVLKRKSVRGLRLPGKLFKAPGSVSYRRLFPYLLDIMGDDFGIPKSGLCHKDEKVMDGLGLELHLSSENHEPTTPEVKTDSCITRDINVSKLTSSPMRLDMEEVNGKCLSAAYVDGKCVGESKIDSTADFDSARDVGNALGHNDFKQDSIHQNNFDCAKDTNHNVCTSEQLVVLNEDCIPMTCDAEIYDNSELNVDQMQSIPQNACHVKPMDSTRSTQQDAIEPHKNKHVPRPYLHGKLIKSPGSVNYRRLLPFLKNLNKDDSGTSKFGDQTHHRKQEVDLYANRFQLPLPSQSEEASIVTGPMHDKVESTILENILVNPAVMLSHEDRPKLISSQDFSELPMHLDVKEAVHECLSASSVQAQSEKIVIGSNDECLSEAKTDFHCVKILTNGFNQVHNMRLGQHNMESPPKDQHLPNISDDIFNLSFEHYSSQETGFTTNCDEINQFVNLEMHESVNRCPPEGQTVSQLDANMIDAEENEKSSLAICKTDDDVVLSHVNISNEEPRQPSEKIISEKPELPDMEEHGEKAGSLLNGLVYGSKMPSKGSSNKYASCAGVIKNGSESKTTPVLNRCPRDKLLKHAGSVNYKRLLPFLLNTVKSNPSPSNNDHHPKLQKLLDQTPFLPISFTNLPVTPLSDSNGNSGAKKETGLQASDLINNSSSPRSQTPEFQSSHDSCKVVQLQDEHVVLNGGKTNEEKPPETYGCCQSLSQLKVTDQLKSPAAGLQKGILRRNPRGCRGLCTCLNCVSFRLHSERAFEFSRNQLLDAEEVAQDLMKELSHVRNMLENSANNTTAFDGSQVLEACRKAFETEQLAKDRLSQMNDELNIHCRTPSLQRPSVKFSDNVKEKVFQSGSQING